MDAAPRRPRRPAPPGIDMSCELSTSPWKLVTIHATATATATALRARAPGEVRQIPLPVHREGGFAAPQSKTGRFATTARTRSPSSRPNERSSAFISMVCHPIVAIDSRFDMSLRHWSASRW